MVHSAVVGLILLLTLPAPSRGQIAKKACTCNGYINARGQGECRTAYKGSIFCFVDDNDCEDGIKCNFKYPGKPRLVYSYLACTNYQFKPCKTKTGKRCHFPFYYKGERYSECTTTIFDPDENEKEFKDLAKECDCEDTEQANEGRNQLTGLAGLAGKGKGGKDEDDPCICYCENRRTGGGLLGYQGSKRRGRPRTGLGAYGRAGSSGLGGLGGRTGLGGLGNTGLGGYGNGGTSGLGNTGLGGYGRSGTSGLGGLGGNTGLGGYGTAGLGGGRTGLGSYGQRGTSGLGGLGGRTGLGGYGAGGTSGLGGLGGRTGLGGLGNGGSQTALGGIRQSGLGGIGGCSMSTIAKLPDFKLKKGGSQGEAWCATVRNRAGKVERWEECGFGCSGFKSTNASGTYFDSPPCAEGPG